MSSPRPLIAGNWKMNGLGWDLDEVRTLAAGLADRPSAARVALCPPATLLHRLADAVGGTAILVGGQDCHARPSGAHTGDIAAEMLAEAGARLVILGHSERRADHGESDADVASKVEAAVRAGLEPIVCVGETLAEREAGRCLQVVRAQAAGSLPRSLAGKPFCLAYEPIWAIGSGLTPTLSQIADVHLALREVLIEQFGDAGAAAPILYGGSVKPSNAVDILKTPEVGGALVGGASLKAADFLPIIRAA